MTELHRNQELFPNMGKITKDRVLERLDALIKKGEEVRKTHKPNPPGVLGPTLSSERFSEWKTASQSFLKRVLGEDDTYFRNFLDEVESGYTAHLSKGMGILKAVKDDIEGGYLFKVESLISAEIFDNFLEQAEYLLREGYKDPAAVLIGGVLESSLETICERENVSYGQKAGIQKLNQLLYKNKVYDKLMLKKVTAWGEIRNASAHAEYDTYDHKDVEEMLQGVGRFVSDQSII